MEVLEKVVYMQVVLASEEAVVTVVVTVDQAAVDWEEALEALDTEAAVDMVEAEDLVVVVDLVELGVTLEAVVMAAVVV